MDNKCIVASDARDTLWVNLPDAGARHLLSHLDLGAFRYTADGAVPGPGIPQRFGAILGRVGRRTFGFGGLSIPTDIAVSPISGNPVVVDIALPYAQELDAVTGTPVHVYGLGTLVARVNIDRTRYTWDQEILVSVWRPIEGQQGHSNAILQAYAFCAGSWRTLAVDQLTIEDYLVAVPPVSGHVILRLVWGRPWQDAEEETRTSLRADFPIEVEEAVPPAVLSAVQRTIQRQRRWVDVFVAARMGALIRGTRLTDAIRPGSQNIDPLTGELQTCLAKAYGHRRDILPFARRQKTRARTVDRSLSKDRSTLQSLLRIYGLDRLGPAFQSFSG